jgi:hypothetical protein
LLRTPLNHKNKAFPAEESVNVAIVVAVVTFLVSHRVFGGPGAILLGLAALGMSAPLDDSFHYVLPFAVPAMIVTATLASLWGLVRLLRQG